MKPFTWIGLAMCVVGCSTAVSGTNSPDGGSSGAPDGGCPIDGTSCGNGLVCIHASCQAGCFIAGTFIVPSEPNPKNSCEVCEPASSTVDWTSVNGPGPIGGCAGLAGQVCNSGACVAGCFIGGQFVAPRASAPGESCLACQPSLSISSWSPLSGSAPDGGSCSAGQVCENGNCTDGCIVDGGFYLTGSASLASACQTCQPTTSTTAFEPTSGLAPDGGCPVGEVCESGSCTAGCWIGDAFVASGVGLPGGSCLQCVPATTTSSYSPVTGRPPDGGSCAGDEVCSEGACTYGCIIEDRFVAAGQPDANHGCRTCDPEVSTQVWVNGFTVWTTPLAQASDVAVADLLGNGDADLIVAGDLEAYLSEGNGTFSDGGTSVEVATPDRTPAVAIPYSNPPLPDIFFVGVNAGAAGTVIDYVKNLGDGGLADCTSAGQAAPCVLSTGSDRVDAITAGRFAGADAGLGLAAVDLTDSRVDYFLTMTSPLASTPFAATPPSGTSTLVGASITSGDFNGDGLDDLIVSVAWDPPYKSDILVLLAQPGGAFANPTTLASLQPGLSQGLAVADFNGDGKLDLVVTDGVGSVLIGLGDGIGGFSPLAPYRVGGSGSESTWLVTGDFNGDGVPDLAVTTNYPPTVNVVFGLGDGRFSAPLLVYTASGQPTSLSGSSWTPPLAPATYGSPTQLLGGTDLNGDVIGLVNNCQ